MMTFKEWFEYTSELPQLHGWRLGQHWFHSLVQTRSALSSRVIGNPSIDPFDDDKNIYRFLSYVRDVWELSDEDHVDAIAANMLHNRT